MPALPHGTRNGYLNRFGPSAIPFLFHGQTIKAWGGPFMGTVTMDGGNWIPYQPSTFPTPPFPEYFSGQSTFSAAGAEILRRWTTVTSLAHPSRSTRVALRLSRV